MPLPVSPDYTIRRLAPEDAAEFKRVRLRSLAEHPDAFASTVEEWDLPLEAFVERITAGHVIGGFSSGGELVGHVLLATQFANRAKTRHKCEIWSVYVIPAARGSGLARRLLEAAIALGRELGFAWLKLGVAEHNSAAIGLYESLGFAAFSREVDHLRLPDGRSITELMMQLKL